MADLVADASILSALFLNEEGSENIRDITESDTSIYAPSFWKFEVSNAVWKRKDIPLKTAKEVIEIIWSFPVYSNESREWAIESFVIAKKHGITFYDSSYIAMARLLNIPLWTLDSLQSRFAMRIGVSLWSK